MARAIGDRPCRHDGHEQERHYLGDRKSCSRRGVIDDDHPQGGFTKKADAPYGRYDPENALVALILPEPGHLAALGGIRPGELQGETEHQRTPRAEGAETRHTEYGRGHRPLEEKESRAVTGQAEYRADRDPGQYQDADNVKPTVPDGANGHAQGREYPAQQQSHHGRYPSGAQQAIGRERGANVEDHDHRDRLEPAAARPSTSGGSLDITA